MSACDILSTFSKRRSSEKEQISKEDLRSKDSSTNLNFKSEALSKIHEEAAYERQRRREIIDRSRDEHDWKRDARNRSRENVNERKQGEQNRQYVRQDQLREAHDRQSREVVMERNRAKTRDTLSNNREEDTKRERRREEREMRVVETREKNDSSRDNKHRRHQNHFDGMRRHSEDFQPKTRGEINKDVTTATTTLQRSRSRTEDERYLTNRKKLDRSREQPMDERKRMKLDSNPTPAAGLTRGLTNRYDIDSPPTRTIEKDEPIENFTHPKKNFRKPRKR